MLKSKYALGALKNPRLQYSLQTLQLLLYPPCLSTTPTTTNCSNLLPYSMLFIYCTRGHRALVSKNLPYRTTFQLCLNSVYVFYGLLNQPLCQQSNCCRSRKCIWGRIPMYAIFAVFYQIFLPVLRHFSLSGLQTKTRR